MAQKDSEFWNRARRAQAKLVERYIYDPDVTLIDIGYRPGQVQAPEIVLRIHVRERWSKARPEARTAFPGELEGIPVVVILGEYGLQGDSPAPSEAAGHPD